MQIQLELGDSMFKLGDRYRLIRNLQNNVTFEEIYEIDSITTTTTESREGGQKPPVYIVSFSIDESSGTIKAKRSVTAEYRDKKWFSPMSFEIKELDWEIIKL